MTDLDLRQIAEHAKKCIDPLHRDITTTLLDAVVEERTDFILEKRKWAEGTQYSKGQPVNVPDRESCRTKALDELNLKGVWPIGGKND